MILEIYVHIPFCERKCNYCDFLSGPADDATKQAYTDALITEIRGRAQTLSRGNKVTSIYFGGGTPSVMSPAQLGAIYTAIGQEFVIDPGAEITIEVNPKSGRDKLHYLREIGFNRLSIGMQSSHKSELELLGRIHTYDDFAECFIDARDAGFKNISVDIMTAIPGQTEQMLAATVNKVLEFSPEHISTYSLIIERGTPFYERFGDIEGPVVGEETERKLYWMTVDMLKDKGYKHYEISNFAKPGYESRHNSGYWVRTPYLGLGLGSSSLLPGEVRVRNTDDFKLYLAHSGELDKIRAEIETLSEADCMSEFMFLGLRRMVGVSESEFKKTFGKTIDSVFPGIVEKHVEDGLLIRENGRIHLSDRGVDLSNQVFVDFLL